MVCQGRGGWKSLERAARVDLQGARKHGYRLRPSQPKLYLSRREANELLWENLRSPRKCAYNEIQPAVIDSGNNDRVVVMPGLYTEPTSRAQPLNDPRCADMTQEDSGGAKTPELPLPGHLPQRPEPDPRPGPRGAATRRRPSPPLTNRQGIPDLGPCVRCNLQLEGSGVKPTDVIIDGASDYESDDPEARPHTLHKHVILRADRADGFVAHNFTVRGALEHGLYVEEADGYRIDTVKMFWAADYGNLTFTSDHGLYTDCDGFGAGDAVLYPGAAPETGEQADLSFYPDAPRINTTVRDCDMRGSVLAYSGSMGNAVRITNNNIYGNTAGHLDRHDLRRRPSRLPGGQRPGRPQLDLLEQPRAVQAEPAGRAGGRASCRSASGIFWAGPQQRPGARQLDLGQLAQRRVPALDPRLPGHARGQHQPGRLVQQHPRRCPPRAATASTTTSWAGCRRDFKPFARALRVRQQRRRPTRGVAPNGVDFWWDEGGVGTVSGNCWFDNVGPDGTAGERDRARASGDGNDVAALRLHRARAAATR